MSSRRWTASGHCPRPRSHGYPRFAPYAFVPPYGFPVVFWPQELFAPTGEPGRTAGFVLFEGSSAMTWRFGPVHSHVRWTCSYLGLLTVMGLFREVRATVRLEGQDASRWSVEVTIPAASIDSGNALRDEILRGPDFLDVERFPLITFRSTGVEPDDGHYRVVGELTLRGVTREVTLDVQDRGEVVDWLGQRSRVLSAETNLKRAAFQVGPPAQAGESIGSDVRISLQVELLRENDAAQLVGIQRRTDPIAAA